MTHPSGSAPKAVGKLASVGARRLVLAACILSLLATLLMVWSVLDPTPLPVMVAMSVGELLGALGLLCYVAAVVAHQWRQRQDSKSA